MRRRGYVYILASQKNGTLYIGVTSDLAGRLEQHRNGTGSKFAARYGVMRLVWFDEYDLITDAIQREKTMKKWPRQWKIHLIEERNPHWHDITWHLL
ncbi:MAG TPA: GIY-YIG nuclease family protein [Rhizobiaceae bacterium]|nr:GIY-YIG nuclease family protein [Rhizobiaceae bacterium]